MSLTISELEEQRAKILEEIEAKAGKISPSNSNGKDSPSLNDWLNAAEQVMPEPPKQTSTPPVQKTNYSNTLLSDSKPSNRLSFFGVIIMLSLLLTVLGLLYIAYSSFQKEQEKVVESQNQNVEQIKVLESDLTTLKKSVTTGGKTELFSSMESQVSALQAEVKELKATIAELQSTAEENSKGMSTAAGSNGITDEQLDQKLKDYTQTLESKIDKKLEMIVQQGKQGRAVTDLPGLVNSVLNGTKQSTASAKASDSETMTVPTVKEPVVQAPISPKAPDLPIISTSSDVNWLLAQPKNNFILQLASMPSQDAAEKMIANKKLKDAKALPQTRNKETNYIVVTGSLKTREEADELAKDMKSKYGINPWIRNIQDLVRRVQ